MKPRHRPINMQRRRVGTHDESGRTDVAVETEVMPEPDGTGAMSLLKNIELKRTPRGEFLVFSTSDGERFALNLDCQEEFGFEASNTLQKWAREQVWE